MLGVSECAAGLEWTEGSRPVESAVQAVAEVRPLSSLSSSSLRDPPVGDAQRSASFGVCHAGGILGHFPFRSSNGIFSWGLLRQDVLVFVGAEEIRERKVAR